MIVNQYSLSDLIPMLPLTVREIAYGTEPREIFRAFRIQKCKFKGLQVFTSIGLYEDEYWLHVSYSYASELPDWEATKFVKNTFIGETKTAYIVLPKISEYVNDFPYCLHLWHCLDKPDYLPDFRRMGTI